MNTVDRPAATLSTSVKILYGLGGMADSIKAVASGLYLLFFYTTVHGLPARLVGLAAAPCLIWDSCIDPTVGRWSDHTSGRFGRRHGWMLAGTVAMAAGFVGLFAPPDGLSQLQLFSWLFLMSLLLRTGHSAFTVPYLALGAELHAGYDERTKVAGYRAAAAQLGAVIASAVTLTVFFPASTGAGSRLATTNYWKMGTTLALLIGFAGLMASLGTWGYRQRGHRASTTRRAITWRQLLRNRAFLLLAASAALFFLGTVINASLGVYFLTYYAGVQEGTVLAVCQFALYGGAILGVAVWARAAPYFDKHHLYATACVLTAGVVISGFWIGRAAGFFGAAFVPLLVIGNALAGATGVGVLVMPPSMLADVADEHELRYGQRCEGAFFGAFSCAQQMAVGLAVAVAGVLVDYFAGIVPGVATQAPLTVARIGILASLLPGTLMLIGGLLILPYEPTKSRAQTVRSAVATLSTSGAASV